MKRVKVELCTMPVKTTYLQSTCNILEINNYTLGYQLLRMGQKLRVAQFVKATSQEFCYNYSIDWRQILPYV